MSSRPTCGGENETFERGFWVTRFALLGLNERMTGTLFWGPHDQYHNDGNPGDWTNGGLMKTDLMAYEPGGWRAPREGGLVDGLPEFRRTPGFWTALAESVVRLAAAAGRVKKRYSMDTEPTLSDQVPLPSRRRGMWRRVAVVVVALLVVYLAAAYLIVPYAWERYVRHHPLSDDDPRITVTSDGHPGDPLNVGLMGTEAEVKEIMRVAKWYPADPLGLKSDLRIGADTVLRRSYDQAPVSNLFLFGRKEDLAFEQPVGNDPRHRHHVRFWRSGEADEDVRCLWLGSASYDEGVGLSHTTGQVTHHIASNVDAERDYVRHSVEQTRGLSETYTVPGFHKTREGKNGGGDVWRTDGDLWVGVIAVRQ